MESTETNFLEITLLITHYNRSKSLKRLLNAFREQRISFGAIVVSDDCSKPEHIQVLQEMQGVYNYSLITTPQNGGLGNNINKGQDAVRTPYTLYVQEDFEPKPNLLPHLQNALQCMKNDSTIDIARFYAYFMYPYTEPYGHGFVEMDFKSQIWANNHLKIYVYSDHPHLRRSSFLTKFGRYSEGVGVDISEYRMATAFIQQKGRGIFFEKFNELFYQKNSNAEPSTANRARWRESKNPLALALRYVYLQFKLLRWTYNVSQRPVH